MMPSMIAFVRYTTIIVFGLAVLPQVSLASNFTDVPAGIWYANDLDIAQEKGWVSGYRDVYGADLHRFGPQDIVTIGQALKVTQLAAGRNPTTNPCAGCHWADPYRQEAAQDYIWLNTKNLDRFATRSEVAAMIANAFHLERDHTVHFKGGDGASGGVTSSSCNNTDSLDDSHMFSDVPRAFRLCAAIAHLYWANVIHGDDVSAGAPKVFRPHDAISRAEFVRMVVNAWASFSDDSPYATINGPLIDADGMHAVERYETYEGGKWMIWNDTDMPATVEFSPPLHPESPVVEVVEPHIQKRYLFTNETIPGEHAFVIKYQQQEFHGNLYIAPDPLQRD